MTIKVIADIDGSCMERYIEWCEDPESMDIYENNMGKIIRKWKKECKGMTSRQDMFDSLDDILGENNVDYRWVDDYVEEIIKAKA